MPRALRILVLALLGILVIAGMVLLIARLGDGPLGPVAGGPLEAGVLTDPPNDWTPLADVPTAELQLVIPPRSRTVWIVVDDGRLFVACGAPTFRLWKQWPHEAMVDGRAILRIDGRRYELEAVRVEDRGVIGSVLGVLAEKYGTALPDGPVPEDDVWIFEMLPRA